MNSSLKVCYEPLDEALFGYRVFYLLTLGVGDCRLLLMMLHTLLLVLWMSPQLKLGRQGQLQHISLFKVFFFIPENQLPVSVKVLFSVHFIWLLFFQKETWVPKFPRSVTPCQSFRQSDIFQKLNKERTYTIQTTTFCLGTARRSRISRSTLDLRWAQNTDPSSLIIVMIAIPQYFPCAVSHTEWMENPSIESYLLQLLN